MFSVNKSKNWPGEGGGREPEGGGEGGMKHFICLMKVV